MNQIVRFRATNLDGERYDLLMSRTQCEALKADWLYVGVCESLRAFSLQGRLSPDVIVVEWV